MLGLTLSNVLDAFVYLGQADPIAFLEVPFYWKSLTLQILGLFICLFADAILIYRGWLIWGQSWTAIALPVVMFMTSIAVFIFIVVELTRTATYLPSDALKLYHGLDAFIVLTMVQNVTVTSMIAYRLWRMDAATATYRSFTGLLPIVWIMVESGLLYTATLLVFLVVNFVAPWVSVIMSAILCGTIGITFSSIIVRCGISSWKRSIRSDDESHNMQPIPINISRRTEVDVMKEANVSMGTRTASTDSLPKRDPASKDSKFGQYSV
ncbi:hypothetical protein DACRYDRAFT_110623 [Dacryopinax primogenitus]|uniref:Transmembrane protein n=1 Tax=Dacryopinax primogenitus (strain DJM 731) TaxID=1858805 RepID=M5G4Q9_DACPD|nr:uncharacterized protein DACRYDRAFT_110623 [Dacryopinax primogenitus]EJT98722.1 hypothetical protein DACRYDRAFT_110623 [Dacryopinax primogenitus]